MRSFAVLISFVVVASARAVDLPNIPEARGRMTRCMDLITTGDLAFETSLVLQIKRRVSSRHHLSIVIGVLVLDQKTPAGHLIGLKPMSENSLANAMTVSGGDIKFRQLTDEEYADLNQYSKILGTMRARWSRGTFWKSVPARSISIGAVLEIAGGFYIVLAETTGSEGADKFLVANFSRKTLAITALAEYEVSGSGRATLDQQGVGEARLAGRAEFKTNGLLNVKSSATDPSAFNFIHDGLVTQINSLKLAPQESEVRLELSNFVPEH